MLQHLPATEQAEILELLEELELAKKREAADIDFLDFVKHVWPGFIEGPHHRIVADAFNELVDGDLKRLMIFMPPRHKLLLDTDIATVDGWKTMATVQPGDYVFGLSGEPVLVTGKSPVFVEDLYKITTSDGHTVITDADHEWLARYKPESEGFNVYSTSELLDRQNRLTGINSTMKLPEHGAVMFPEQELPVHPWVLGAWLGDGAADNGTTFSCSPEDEPHMRSTFEKYGHETTDRVAPNCFGVRHLHTELRKMGLLGNKHIPEQYMIGSIEQRLSLIQGLMDTDGCVSKSGKCTFHQSDEDLMKQFVMLINSMGLKCTYNSRQTNYSGAQSKESYRASFKLKDACTLPRKATRCRDIHRFGCRTVSVKKLNIKGSVQCIQVASEDSIFLVTKNFIPTRNTKSEFASHHLPAWFLGKYPYGKIIQTSNKAELAVEFGRKVRNLVNSDEYHELFPDVTLAADSKAAGRWHTNKRGEYFAAGVGGAVTGRGADLLIIDDPHTEQEAASNNPDIYNSAYSWYTAGPRQRLQPGGRICMVVTRWSKIDLPGQVLRKSIEGGDEWRVIELPAILDEHTDNERPVWPGFWKLEDLKKTRDTLPVQQWQAQYQQHPTSEEGALVKREWWQTWKHKRPPDCDFVIQAWDTALTTKDHSDYSACTTWGVFQTEDGVTNIILLDAYKERLEFPDLKDKALEFWKQRQPDSFIVEAKASGQPLIDELRRMGIPVHQYTPSRGNDKMSRVNSVTDLFRSGHVWVPDNKYWAEMVVEEMAEFPYGENDDLVDSSVMALMRFRQGGFIQLDSDDPWNERLPRREAAYY